MANEPKILAFAGSARAESWNKKLVPAAVAGAEQRGAAVTTIDLRDFPMPIFDEDFEAAEGTPEHARRFKRLLMEHDGFLIACPEYNSSITPLLKNVIDWASRPDKDDAGPLVAFRGKCAALMAASSGGLGGLRGLVTVRSILSNIGVLVVPTQVAVPRIHELIGEDGRLADDSMRERLHSLGGALANLLFKMKV